VQEEEGILGSVHLRDIQNTTRSDREKNKEERGINKKEE
jgi:hypothetical protein